MDRLSEEVKLPEEAQFHFGLDFTTLNGQSISADQALLAQWNATSAYTWRLEARTSPLFGSKLEVIVLEDLECVVIGDPRGRNDSEVSTGIVLITSNTRLISTLYGETLGRVS